MPSIESSQVERQVERLGPARLPRASVDALDRVNAQGRLEHSIAATLCLIAAARAEREAAPVQAARQHLAEIYGQTRLRRRLEREAAAA